MAPSKTLVVIGNGMVGHRLCERLRELDAERRCRIVVFGEEPRPAYDRVHLTSYLSGTSADELALATPEWYSEQGIELHTGTRVVGIDRARSEVTCSDARVLAYDMLALATGSAPFVPELPGVELAGVFVYRTLEDLDAIRAWAKNARCAAVLGGGLLGLEAAKAVLDLGLETHVIECAPRLMPRQIDARGSAVLAAKISALGVRLHLKDTIRRIAGEARIEALELGSGERLEADLLVISAGIRPRDELGRAAELRVGARGGIEVDDRLGTSDPKIFAIGEVALHRGLIHGLVGPGYAMANVLATNLNGGEATFTGFDSSTKLKLLGVDVASVGNPFADESSSRSIVFEDLVGGVYKKLLLDANDERLLGAILVGDVARFSELCELVQSGARLPKPPEQLVFSGVPSNGSVTLNEAAQVCSCNNVSKGQILNAIRQGPLGNVVDVKKCTKAGTGCGGCLPLVTEILNTELAARGELARPRLCEHFAFTRQELFQIVKIKGYRSFDELLGTHGSGAGCEICKPSVASILASLWNEPILEHENLQDTNDRFLANLQRGGLYSVVPRIPAGEITPEKLIALGQVAQKYGLYTKITGGQRIDLLGARLNQLPDIWEDLVRAGFESGHAYGKAMRTVKSCVGTTWCRFGVQDSVGFAIRVENRYKGIRAPHKMKSAVSGCIRECAEAQSKDFGVIATEKGWNVYVCGNGGTKPRHADLLAADLDEDTVIRYLDRFIMYYISSADRLTRTSVWLEKLPGGIDYLRDVIIHDRLGICEELERQMNHLVDTYRCEWAEVVNNPERRARFRHFVNADDPDPHVELVTEREQRRPANWIKTNGRSVLRLPVLTSTWVKVARACDVPKNAGVCVKYGKSQIALFNFAARGQWLACQNMCPHKRDMVLSRGLVGDENGIAKVACPVHKKTFSLETGEGLSDEGLELTTFSAKEVDGDVYLLLPSEEQLERLLGATERVQVESCDHAACSTQAIGSAPQTT